jgi:3-phenylpropionate/trans-cinnamate dioxygenase ferredoxin subunit
MNYTQLDPDLCEFYEVAAVEEIPNGERLFLEIGDDYIVLFNVAGGFYAIADLCSHDDGPLGDGGVEGHSIICPRHGAKFDLRSGKVLSMPAVTDIPAYPVRIIEGQIEIGIPKE